MALPQVVVQTELPEAVPHGRLLDVIDVLPETLKGDEGDKWLGGVTWQPHSCRELQTTDADVCDPTGFATDDIWTCETAITQPAFQIYDVFEGSTLQLREVDVDNMLRPHMRLLQSWAFAQELANGTASGGASLKSTATAPTKLALGTATPIRRAIAVLSDELGRRLNGGRGLIHMPVSMLEYAVADGVVFEVGDQYEVASGHRVVGDAGYADMPAPTGGGDASSAFEDWVYASGPVWYRATGFEDINQNPVQTLNISRNLLRQWLSSFGILVFDRCAVTAVQAQYS